MSESTTPVKGISRRSFLKTSAAVAGVAAVGGGAKSKLWMQIKAAITNVTLHTPKVFEATTLGVAMLIEYMLKGKVTVDPDSIANTFQPNPENVGPYDTVYHDYMLLFRTICKYYNHPDHHE